MVLHLPCYAWCFFIGHDLGGPQSVALTGICSSQNSTCTLTETKADPRPLFKKFRNLNGACYYDWALHTQSCSTIAHDVCCSLHLQPGSCGRLVLCKGI